MSIVTDQHTNDAVGIYVDIKDGGYTLKGVNSAAPIFNKAAIQAGHSVSQFLEIDHDGTSAELNAMGTTDQIEFQFGDVSVMELTSAGHLLVSGDVDSARLSDQRYKDNVKTIDNALDMVHEMNGVSFTWNDKSADHLEGDDLSLIHI